MILEMVLFALSYYMKKNLFLISSAVLLGLGLSAGFSIQFVSADTTDVAVDQLISLILS